MGTCEGLLTVAYRRSGNGKLADRFGDFLSRIKVAPVVILATGPRYLIAIGNCTSPRASSSSLLSGASDPAFVRSVT